MKGIAQRFGALKLNRQFTIVMFTVLVVPVVILSSVLFNNMRGMLIDEKINGARREMEQTRADVEKAVELCGMTTQVFQNNYLLRVFLSELADGREFSTEYLMDFNRNIIGGFERLVIANPYLYQARVYSTADDGPEMMPVLFNGARMRRLSWAEESWTPGQWQFDITDELFPDNVMNAVPHIMSLVTDIEDYERGRIGVLEVSVRMDGLLPVLFEDGGETWGCFAAADGRLYSTEQSAFGGLRDEIFAVIDTESSEPQYAEARIGGRHALVSAMPLDVLGGWYYEVSPLEDINARTDTWLRLFILAMLLLAALLAVVVNLLVKTMLKRMYRIFETVSQAQAGNLTAAVPDPGGGEVGEMGRLINKMLARMEQLMRENVDRQLLAKNSEIRALQNQINAHFIYNVLESIKMMAEVEEHYAVSDTITALGKMLRYSMRRTGGSASVAEEAEHVRNYLALINLRCDYSITLCVEIPEGLSRQQIPRLSLQPVVENSVTHGLENQSADTVIEIRGREFDEYFLIEIKDYGRGMTGGQLSELEKKIAGGIGTGEGGIGLKNVQDRIVMAYGSSYGISVNSEEGRYTEVTIKLPYGEKI